MRKIITTLWIAMTIVCATAQTKRVYCQAITNPTTDYPNAIFDFGRKFKQLGLFDSNKERLVDQQGKIISFTTTMQMVNYMIEKGWTLKETFPMKTDDKTMINWVFCKDAQSIEEAMENIMTDKKYKEMIKRR